MNIRTLIKKLQDGQYEKEDFTSIIFCGKEYSQLFFPFFLKRFTQITTRNIEYIDLSLCGAEYIKSKLNVSFLGQRACYWLSNISNLNAKEKKYWLSYLKDYKGPNSVLFFVEKKDCAYDQAIDIDGILEQKNIVHVTSFLFPKHFGYANVFLSKALTNLKNYSVDDIMLLVHYGMFLGCKTREFIDSWLFKIVPQESSLFILAQNFFAKKKQIFLKQISGFLKMYPSLFWVSFWSDQLWRASIYVFLMNKKEFEEAKKVSYRLPFSFINYDWKRYSSTELKNAHKFLYSIDHSLKNSGPEYGLDVFYLKFLLNEFV